MAAATGSSKIITEEEDEVVHQHPLQDQLDAAEEIEEVRPADAEAAYRAILAAGAWHGVGTTPTTARPAVNATLCTEGDDDVDKIKEATIYKLAKLLARMQ